jgi:hypothetical protein
MKISRTRIIGSIAAVIGLCLATILASRAQQPQPFRPGYPAAQAPAGSSASMNAQREQIWNSPNMLRARAWLQDYCRVSKKFTPEDEQKYLAELQNLTPGQMKLWLLKFDHEEEARQQQHAMWEQAHSAALSRAMAADQATQKSYAAINQEETAAAGEEQQQLNEQQQAQQNLVADKQLGAAGAYGPYGAYPGYGGIHYHFHLYPY